MNIWFLYRHTYVFPYISQCGLFDNAFDSTILGQYLNQQEIQHTKRILNNRLNQNPRSEQIGAFKSEKNQTEFNAVFNIPK